MYTDMDNKELINQLSIEVKTIESLARILKTDCKENIIADGIIQATHRIDDISNILQSKEFEWCEKEIYL